MEDNVYNVYDKPWREVVGLFSSSIDPVARAVDKEISLEMMLESSSKPAVYIISMHISSAIISNIYYGYLFIT